MDQPRVTRAALRDFYPDERATRRLALVPDYRCIYVKNPKVASSTIMLWLHRIHFDDPEFQPAGGIHRAPELPTPREVGWRRVVRMLNGRAYRFSFVRDPIRRVESAYLDKVATMPGWGREQYRANLREQLGLPPAPGEPIGFDQFVTALETQELLALDPHWRPQYLNLMHPLIQYDFIGRIETFAVDLEQVREACGMPVMPIQTQNAAGAAKPTSSLFDGRPDLLRRVRAVYAKDFELYGY